MTTRDREPGTTKMITGRGNEKMIERVVMMRIVENAGVNVERNASRSVSVTGIGGATVGRGVGTRARAVVGVPLVTVIVTMIGTVVTEILTDAMEMTVGRRVWIGTLQMMIPIGSLLEGAASVGNVVEVSKIMSFS